MELVSENQITASNSNFHERTKVYVRTVWSVCRIEEVIERRKRIGMQTKNETHGS